MSFLEPRYDGKRFEDHLFLVELGPDLTVTKDIILAIAKDLYIKDNPGKKSVPRGFASNFIMGISKIREGSTVAAIEAKYDSEHSKYFENAKETFLNVIETSNTPDLPIDFNNNHLYRFSKLGKHLKEDEKIFYTKSSGAEVIYDNVVRLNLNKKNKEPVPIEKDLSFFARVTNYDTDEKYITFKLNDGNEIYYTITDEEFSELIPDGIKPEMAKNYYEIIGEGKILDDKIESLDIITDANLFEKAAHLDKITKRLAEITKGNAGKLLPVPSDFLVSMASDLLIHLIENYSFEAPSIYLSNDGEINLAWEIDCTHLQISISEEDKEISFQAFKKGEIDSLEEKDFEFDRNSFEEIAASLINFDKTRYVKGIIQ